MTVEIDRDVIDPAADIAKANFGFELERRLHRLGQRFTGTKGQHRVPTPMSAAK